MIETGHFAELDNILRLTLRQYQLVFWLRILIALDDGVVAKTNTTLHWRMAQQQTPPRILYKPLSSPPPSARTFSGTSRSAQNLVRAGKFQSR